MRGLVPADSDDLQRARARAHRRSVAVGDRAQARALCEAGPRRLRCRAPPRRGAVRHPLDPRKPRAVDHGELLADGLLLLPTPAARAAPRANTGPTQPRIS